MKESLTYHIGRVARMYAAKARLKMAQERMGQYLFFSPAQRSGLTRSLNKAMADYQEACGEVEAYEHLYTEKK